MRPPQFLHFDANGSQKGSVLSGYIQLGDRGTYPHLGHLATSAVQEVVCYPAFACQCGGSWDTDQHGHEPTSIAVVPAYLIPVASYSLLFIAYTDSSDESRCKNLGEGREGYGAVFRSMETSVAVLDHALHDLLLPGDV